MLLFQTAVFLGISLVVRARLTLLLDWFVGSPGCLAFFALLRTRGA